jgi:hypothetical protein
VRSGSATYPLTIGGSLSITTVSLPEATVGVSYSVTLQANGGSGAKLWTASGLPGGLNLNGATGLISGTPTASGSFPITVGVSDSSGAASKQLTLIVQQGLTITTTTLPNGTTGVSYTATLAASGGSGARSWGASGLPSGLGINSGTGTISGFPAASGTFTVTFTVTDSTGSASKQIPLTIAAGLTITTASLPAGATGAAYTATLVATGGSGTRTWTASGLPANLTINTLTGAITGTPVNAGSFTVTITVADGSGSTNKQFTLTITQGLTITTVALPAGTVGVAYSATVEASGGSGTRTWTASGLPSGLLINGSSGVISGTPAAAGTFSASVTVADGSGSTNKLFTLTIGAGITITTVSLPAGTAGVAYSTAVAATGGTGAFTWSATGLPANLGIGPATGVISGTPLAAGSSTVTISVTDGAASANKQFTLTIGAGLTITTTALPAGVAGVGYSTAVAASGGTGALTWSAAGLPANLGITPSTGVIAGTPVTAGSSTVTINVTDGVSSATKQFTLTVTAGLTITTTALPGGTAGVAYSALVEASGGSGARIWSATGLPGGLGINSATGAITGTPLAAGTSAVTVSVTDSSGGASRQFTLTIGQGLTILTNALPAGTVGVNYSASLEATGGGASRTWSASGLPLNLGISPTTGQISGIPQTAGTFTVTISVSDGATTANRQFTLTIGQGLSITTAALPAGTTGVSYLASLEAAGGSGTRTWGATGLPSALGINSSTGAISGTPQVAGTFSVAVTVTDSSGSASRTLPLTINSGLSITTASLPAGAVGIPYAGGLVATGVSGTLTWTISLGQLPQGLVLNSSTGLISGTPLGEGTANFTVMVQDSAGGSTTRELSIQISPGLTITTTSLAAATVGVPYSAALQAVNASGALNWAATTGLPPGLILNAATGAISGTPTTAGTFQVNAAVSAAGGGSAARTIPLTVVSGLTIVTGSLPAATVGQAYTATLSVSGGTAPYTWAVAAGALPAGLTLTGGTGVIAGTPISATGSPFTMTIRVTDANNVTDSKPLTIAVTAGLTILTTALPQAFQGVAYTATLIATGGSGTGYTWSIVSGSLPAGLALQPTGAISGTPTGIDQPAFTVRVTDSLGATATRSLQISSAGAATLSIITTTLPTGAIGVPYTASLQATGGSSAYQWAVSGGQLPPGISLSLQGVLSGTPAAGGTFSFTVRASDAQSPASFAERGLTVTISGGGLTISTSALPTASVGSNYNVTLQVTGGTQPFTWSVQAGQLPFGLGLSPAGQVSGIPAVPGNYTFNARVADATGAFATRVLTLVVNPALTITNSALPPGSIGVAYSVQLTATGGSGAGYTWGLLSGPLPQGLVLNPASGVISGVPVANGASSITVQVSDSGGATASRSFSITIGSSLAIGLATLPAAATSAPYSQTLNATGGSPPYTWTLASGSLPQGLQLGVATGQITGTPTAGGLFVFTAQVQDATGATASRQFILTVAEGLTITTPALRAGAEGTPYSETLQASGGTAPYSWAVAVGNLPAGLTLSSAGVISGTPASIANNSFIVSVTDAAQQTITKAFTLIINARSTITISTPLVLPPARVQGAYRQEFQASGGTPPYTWTLAPGSTPLPIGLTLSTDGVLTGSPSSAGTFSFSLRVADAAGGALTQTFSLPVTQGLAITTASTLPPATAGAAYTATLAAAGGQPEYRWTLATGALPTGLTLSTAGVVSGTPGAVGTFNFQARVTDAAGAEAVAALTLVVRLPAPPSVTITGLGETVEPAQQPRINLTLGAPFPVTLTGTLTMTFTSDAAVPANDPAVVFANGRRTATFTVDAGSTLARFADGAGILQTGTVAGLIELSVRLEAGGQDLTPSPAPRQTARVNSAAPVLRTVRARRVTGGLEVEIIGFATSRELRQAVFRFTPIPGSALQTTELNVALESGARAWYESEASRQFGSQFTMTQQFNVQGDTSAIASVTVTITNAQGTSAAATASFQ